MKILDDLDQKARILSNEAEGIARLDDLMVSSSLANGLSLNMALLIHFTYYGLLFDIHTTLTYPWSRGIINLRRHPTFRTQVERSYAVVAEASRAVILESRFIHLDAACPFL